MKRFGTLALLLCLAPAASAQRLPVAVPGVQIPEGAAQPQPGSGWLGVRSSLTVHFHLDGSAAATSEFAITEVYPGGPAWAAGIRAGDVVQTLNGQPARLDRFQSLSQRLVPGDPVSLTVARDGRRLEFSLEATSRPQAEALVPNRLQNALDSTRTVFATRLALVDAMLVDPAPFRVEVGRIRADQVRAVDRLRTPDGATTRLRIRTADGVFEWSSPEGEVVWSFRPNAAPTPAAAAPLAVRVLPRANPDRGQEAITLRRAAPLEVTGHQVVRPLAPYLAGTNRVAGAGFTPLVPAMATYFGPESGLLVTDVAERTPASDAGLAPGDVIVAAGGIPVTAIDQLRSALGAPESSTTLTVVRRGREITLRLIG